MIAIPKTAKGDQGRNTFNYNSNYSTEHLSELAGQEGSVKYRQMAKGDDCIGMILRVHKNPIRSCSWSIPAPDDATPEEQRAADIANKWFFGDNRISFDTLLSQILSFLEYGFSLFETYYQIYTFEGQKYFVPIIEQRLQTSIVDILPDKRIVKQSTIERGQQDISFDNLVFFTLNQQGEDLRGESLLRNAYRAWKDKKVYEEWLGIGIQRSANGIPSLTVPKGTKPSDPDYLAAETLLQQMIGHEDAYMIFPEGWVFTVHDLKFNVDQVQKAVEAKNTAMSLSVLAQFILLGQQGNTGAFALSRDQSDFFLDGLSYNVDLIERVFNKNILLPFIKLNFGDTIEASRIGLKGKNLNKKAGVELSNVLAVLKGSGFIKPIVDDEIMFRSTLDLPELSEEEIEDRRNNNMDTSDPDPDKSGDDINTDDAEDDNAKTIKLSEPNLKKRLERINTSIEEVNILMKENLSILKDKFIKSISDVLNRGSVEIQGLKNIEISDAPYRKKLEQFLAGIAVESYREAKKKAKLNIKLSEPIDPKEIPQKILKQFVLNQAQSIVDDQVAGLRARAILAATNGPIKGYSIAQTLSNAGRAIDDFIDSSGVVVGGSLAVVGTTNFGEQQFYKEIEDQLWGYRFVGVDDAVQSEICRAYDGKTFSVNSPELSEATPPLHPNCRSHMEPIYKSEEKPEIDNFIPAPSIRKQKSIF